MVADDGRLRAAQAAQACVICKTRKKKCNRSLPSCGYCIRKELHCVYARGSGHRYHDVPSIQDSHTSHNRVAGARPSMGLISSRTILSPASSSGQTTADDYQNQVYLEIHSIIRGTKQFVDDISARYFQGFHPHLPIISRTSFYNRLITLGTAPTADFSILLLAICLVTHTSALGHHSESRTTGNVEQEQQSLYLTARSFFAQLQVSSSPTVPLIQAGLLLAMYDYIQGRPEDAFVAIASCARLAYAARIHTRSHHQTYATYTTTRSKNTDLLLQAEEATNTWWEIVICERIFFTEVTILDQPLLTVFLGGDSRLPSEPQVLDQLDISDSDSLPNISVSCLTSPKVGGFGRKAQATCLLDQVFQSFDTPDIDSRLLQLDRLDTNIQAFLSLVIPQCQSSAGVFCAAINIAIRALFTLHWHILSLQPQAIRANFKTLEEWHKSSQSALDTATKMVVDTAEFLITGSTAHTATQIVDTMPPIYPYTAHAALRHIHSSTQREGVGWQGSAEDILQTSLDRYFQRWSASSESIRV